MPLNGQFNMLLKKAKSYLRKCLKLFKRSILDSKKEREPEKSLPVEDHESAA